jgi:hypothetical protein
MTWKHIDDELPPEGEKVLLCEAETIDDEIQPRYETAYRYGDVWDNDNWYGPCPLTRRPLYCRIDPPPAELLERAKGGGK